MLASGLEIHSNLTMNWSPDPILIELGPLAIRWYSLMFLGAFFLGFHIMVYVFKQENKPVEDVDYVLTSMFVGTLIGARLGHCLFYEPAYYLSNPIEILKVWKGGLASHGAAIGIFTAIYFYSKKRPDQPYLWILSRLSLAVSFAGILIRVGNFFNSEIIGNPTDLPWAIIFSNVDDLPRHPSQLYESLCYAITFFFLLYVYKKSAAQISPAKFFGLFLTLLFSSRFLVEFSKTPQAAFAASLPVSMGQILSIPFILFGLYLLCKTEDSSGKPD